MNSNVPDFSKIQPFSVGDHYFDGAYVMLAVGMHNGLDQEMREVSAWIAFWGAVSSDAKALHDAKESAYRVDRDRWKTNEMQTRSKKPTKTALDDEWRTLPDYPKWERKKTEAERAWNIATYVYEALLRKANMLSALGKLELDHRFSNPSPSLT